MRDAKNRVKVSVLGRVSLVSCLGMVACTVEFWGYYAEQDEAIDVGSALGEIARGTTHLKADDTDPPCVPIWSYGRDVAHRWTAPVAGRYVFDTIGSEFDTILYDPNQSEYCNDDAVGVASELPAKRFWRGSTEIVVVDGWDAGEYVLNVRRCPDAVGDLFGHIFYRSSIGDACDIVTTPCGPTRTPEARFFWHAPSTGVFSFDTRDSDADTVLSVGRYEYEAEDDAEDDTAGWEQRPESYFSWRCNDDYWPASKASKLSMFVDEGDVVQVVVERVGQGDGYSLEIQECSDAHFDGADLPLRPSGTLRSAHDDFNGGCIGPVGVVGEYDAAFEFSPTLADAHYVIREASGDRNAYLYVLSNCEQQKELGCSGAPLRYVDRPLVYTGMPSVTVELVGEGDGLIPSPTLPYLIVLDGYDVNEIEYVLEIEVCEGYMDLSGSALPIVEEIWEVPPATNCYRATGPIPVFHRDVDERLLQWTAPAAGVYIFDTCESGYGSLIYPLEDPGTGELIWPGDNSETGPSAGFGSVMIYPLQEGETLSFAVETAWETDSVVLTISEFTGSYRCASDAPVSYPLGVGDCCETHVSPGCSNEEMQAVVCQLDAYCCVVGWDEACAWWVDEQYLDPQVACLGS